MNKYSFITSWILEAPLDRVWEAIYQSEQWAKWWECVSEVVELKKGDENGVGSIRKYKWNTPIGYPLSFDIETTKVEAPFRLEGLASGDLNGIGKWQLSSEGCYTRVVYYWDVYTRKRWMNLISPVARPLFKWNHNMVMAKGYSGLCRLLDCNPD